MNESLIAQFEARLGCTLPIHYREFLRSHRDKLLDPCLEFVAPRSGVIDLLFTIHDLIENDESRTIGIPERGLLHIGDNLLGGALYLCVQDEGFGEIHYAESYRFQETFSSFEAFLAECRPGNDKPS